MRIAIGSGHGGTPLWVQGAPAKTTPSSKPSVVVHQVCRERRQNDLDMLWYLWTGPVSPMFGKDKMATLESYVRGSLQNYERIPRVQRTDH